jgi:probable rRNA maturation factor
MVNGTKKIKFHYLEGSFYLPSRTYLKEFILNIFKNEGFKIEAVDYIFCSDNYLLQINKAHLAHNTYTDIITFQYSKTFDPIASEIYISIDRVKENSQLYKTYFLGELYRVMFHGALHLCNYKDKLKRDSILMRSKENFYLEKYVSRGTKSLKP